MADAWRERREREKRLYYFVERSQDLNGVLVSEFLADVGQVPYRSKEVWKPQGRPLLLSQSAARQLVLNFKKRRKKLGETWDYRAVLWG